MQPLDDATESKTLNLIMSTPTSLSSQSLSSQGAQGRQAAGETGAHAHSHQQPGTHKQHTNTVLPIAYGDTAPYSTTLLHKILYLSPPSSTSLSFSNTPPLTLTQLTQPSPLTLTQLPQPSPLSFPNLLPSDSPTFSPHPHPTPPTFSAQLPQPSPLTLIQLPQPSPLSFPNLLPSASPQPPLSSPNLLPSASLLTADVHHYVAPKEAL